MYDIFGIKKDIFIPEKMIGGTMSAQEAPQAAGSSAPAEEAPPTKEAPPPEDEEDSDEDFGLGLFD